MPKSGVLVSLFSSPSLQEKLKNSKALAVKEFLKGDLGTCLGGGKELTGSGTEGRCSHNLQSDQHASF